jgi:regulatory protein
MTGNLRYAEKMSKSRPPKRISKSTLENAALFYLQRFSASTESLRRVLLRRVERSAKAHGDDPEVGVALVTELLIRYQTSGLLDDQRFAEGKSRTLLRRGRSQKMIRQELARQGVAADVIDLAIDDLTKEFADADGSCDRPAAQAYARRRRLGPFRSDEARADHRDRDMAALGRAGFSWEIARRVIDGEDE